MMKSIGGCEMKPWKSIEQVLEEMKENDNRELEEKIKRLLKDAVRDPEFLKLIQRIVRTEIERNKTQKRQWSKLEKGELLTDDSPVPIPRIPKAENVVTDTFKKKADQWLANARMNLEYYVPHKILPDKKVLDDIETVENEYNSKLTWCGNCGDAKVVGKPCKVCGFPDLDKMDQIMIEELAEKLKEIIEIDNRFGIPDKVQDHEWCKVCGKVKVQGKDCEHCKEHEQEWTTGFVGC